MIHALLAIARLSVRPSITFVIHEKLAIHTTKRFSQHYSPILLVFRKVTYVHLFPREPPEKWRQMRGGRFRLAFFGLFLAVSPKRREIRPKLLLITNSKSHMPFRLASSTMTLSDLERSHEAFELVNRRKSP